MLKLLKYIRNLFQISMAKRSGRTDIYNKKQVLDLTYIESIKIDYAKIVYAGKRKTKKIDFIEPLDINFDDFSFLSIENNVNSHTKSPFIDLLDSLSDYNVRYSTYIDENNKNCIVFFVFPPFKYLNELFNIIFIHYVHSHLISNFLEQTRKTIKYILHKSEVIVLNISINQLFNRYLLTNNLNFYGKQI